MVVEATIGKVTRESTRKKAGCYGGDVGGMAWVRIGTKLIID
jgi:hypothetical protein